MIKIDPEFQALIPPLATEERQQLEANILADGCRDPLVVWNGTLIDGHNRYEICTRHGLPYSTVDREFESRDAVKVWMIDNQKGRRNLTDGWKFELVRVRKSILLDKGKANLKTNIGDGQRLSIVDKGKEHNTQQELATELGWSTGKVAMADKVWSVAEPEVVQQIKDGEKTINEVYQAVKKQEKKAKKEAKANDQEAKAVAAGVKGNKRVKVQSGEWWQLGSHRLFCGDTSTTEFTDGLEKAAFCFADPPYGAGKEGYNDSAFYWEHDYLIDLADVVVVTPGIVSIFDFAKKTQMPYLWSVACWLNNGMTRGAIGFGNWIYGAVFSRGSIYRNSQDFFQIAISLADNDDTKHSTRKPAKYMVWIVELFTKPGELVIDPFAGSGQTLLVCEVSGRRCITGELDPMFCSEIIGRWQELTGNKAVKL